MTHEVPRNAAPEPGDHVEEVWSKRHVRLLRVPEPTTRSRVLAMVPSDEQPSPLALARLSNHAAICRRLDGVPHVVQLLAAQPRPGTGAVLMAHADGRPLSDWVRDVAGTPDGKPPDLVAWLRAMHALAAALEGVHAAGIVLKSLAPQRVLYDPVHGAVLTDFGLATRMPRELQEALPASAIEGTLAYMAPEQSGRLARGIDARSDLYALGCVAHELLTASPPFVADDPQALVQAHLAQPPRLPAWIAPNVPPVVVAIVYKLLAKEPSDRYQSARGLRLDLERCLAGAGAGGATLPDFALDQAEHPEHLLLPAHLYGRQDELRQLVAALDTASTGPPRLVVVEGPSGIGKTALVRELQQPLAARQGLFVQGKFEQYRIDLPYLGLARALRDLTRWLGHLPEAALRDSAQRARAAVGDDRGALLEIEPQLARLLGTAPAAPPLPPAEAERRQAGALCRLLGALCRRERPLVLFLDDLQWADPDSLRLLAGVIVDRGIEGLLVVLCLRPQEAAPHRALHDLLDRLTAQGCAP